MIQFTPHMRILVATSPLDMRRGMDGIAAHLRLALGENPMSGAVFLFISRSRKHLRILTYDGQGYLLATKRLSAGRFPESPKPGGEGAFLRRLQTYQAQILLQGGDPQQVRALEPWKRLPDSSDLN